jgi:hypothetical protein
MKRRLAAALVVLATAGGCCRFAGPNWAHPGSAACQQKRALRYDPYPENEPGPSVEGTRPREYANPPPEVSRARWTDGKWEQ